jgi:hypothetical protein
VTRITLAAIGAIALGLSLSAQQAPPPAAPNPPGALGTKPVAAHEVGAANDTALVKQYCVTCHNDRTKAGTLSLASFDAAKAPENAAVAEKMIRKIRAGMMPPAGARRPEPAVLGGLAAALETRIDRAAVLNPNPGWRLSQRLNRAEYARAIKDLLELEIDVTPFLPADTISDGFDNIADTQTISTTLMEGYLRAASQISRLAVGDRQASATSTTWKVPRTQSQMRHVEGAPIGTRGGLSVVHVFPADGEYQFRILLHSGPTGDLFGGPYGGEKIDISIDGERVALVDINPRMNEQDPNGLNIYSPKIHVKAGPQRVSAAFISRFDGPVDDLMIQIEHTLADTNIGEVFGTTALPHIRDFTVTGPFAVTGISDTVSRRRIFTCRPTTAREESACANQIVKRLATQAYRGAVGAEDFNELMSFYERGRKGADFESGIRLALQAILASPRFLFRMERAVPCGLVGQVGRVGLVGDDADASAKSPTRPTRPTRPTCLTDHDLASRLSFFMWGALPDAELLKAASNGTLATPAGFDKQVRRMLADRRSEALSKRFASMWLRLQDAEQVRPDHHFYSYWDTSLTRAFVRETELFFESLVREDRPLLDLLTADYTFVNERIAKHYGIPNILGDEFRRVTLADPNRRGILGHGSVLLLTSIADRTSPVQRGKWVLEVLLGSPPPPPPPNVPLLEETKAADGARMLSVRERMEEHRKNPSCTPCHRVIDPLGLALENFDATGKWRVKDNGVAIDSVGQLYDGTEMNGPAGLRSALLKHSDLVILSFTESLMTYALGRRVEYYDMPRVRAIVRDAKTQDNRLSSFILGVVNSPAFRMSKAAPAETTER